MSREEVFRKKQESMSDNELIEFVEKEIYLLIESKGATITMSIPPSVQDTDMLLCELLDRFKNRVKKDEKLI